MNLKGKNILVTGGAGFGVASGICKALFEDGASLIINEKDEEKMDAVLKKYPGSVPAIADVGNPDEVEELYNEQEKKVGIIHGLVNNLGIRIMYNHTTFQNSLSIRSSSSTIELATFSS